MKIEISLLKRGGIMSLQELMPFVQAGGVGLIVILAGLIKIPKIEINLWTLIAHSLGRALNTEVIKKVDDLNNDFKNLAKDFENHLQIEEEERMRYARQRILRFNDELLFRESHSKEHYDDILDDINRYEQYCLDHPDYVNNKANLAIENIRKNYDYHLKHHDFLGLQEII